MCLMGPIDMERIQGQEFAATPQKHDTSTSISIRPGSGSYQHPSFQLNIHNENLLLHHYAPWSGSMIIITAVNQNDPTEPDVWYRLVTV